VAFSGLTGWFRGNKPESLGNRATSAVSFAELSDKELRDIGGHAQVSGATGQAIEYFRAVYERNPPTELSLGEYCRALIRGGDWDTVKRLARETDFRVFDPKRWAFLHDLDEHERQIYLEVVLEACQTPEAIASLSRTIRYIVENKIEGDFVECGVYKGASIVCIIRTLQTLGISDRSIWLYDTFEGMPRPEPIDEFYYQTAEDDFSVKTWDKRRRDDGSGGSDWVYGPLSEVKSYIERTGYPADRIKFIKGMVEDTIPTTAPERISLLRLDTDFYRSTRHELLHLYPRLMSGGVLIVDDYGAYRGSRQATDEYISENKLRLFLSRIDEHVRLAIKP